MFLYVLLVGSIPLLLIVATFPKIVYRTVQQLNTSIIPDNDEDRMKILKNTFLLYYGLLFPIVLILEVLYGVFFWD